MTKPFTFTTPVPTGYSIIAHRLLLDAVLNRLLVFCSSSTYDTPLRAVSTSLEPS